MTTPDVISHEWLEAIDNHPGTTTEDLLAAYEFLGVGTDRTPEQLKAAVARLAELGFLQPVLVLDTEPHFVYRAYIPGAGA